MERYETVIAGHRIEVSVRNDEPTEGEWTLVGRFVDRQGELLRVLSWPLVAMLQKKDHERQRSFIEGRLRELLEPRESLAKHIVFPRDDALVNEAEPYCYSCERRVSGTDGGCPVERTRASVIRRRREARTLTPSPA